MSPGRRRASPPGETGGPRIERWAPAAGETGVSVLWRIRSMAAARQILRARHQTTQAGFTAEAIPRGRLRHHPILISDGPQHDEQRRKVGRFFAPTVLEQDHAPRMAELADRLVREADPARLRLEDLALHYTVGVTAEVVGLTDSDVPRMSRRLVAFFRQPPFDIRRRDLGRTRRQWMRAAARALVPIARFWWHDVRPAIRSRRAASSGDIISHLIAEGYSDASILVECVTYGTAGMVTTREFIVMAAWHLLSDEALLARFRSGDREERHAILAEILRLEPVVGHLYRRARAPIALVDGEEEAEIQPGDLIDVDVRASNADDQVVGEDPRELCPGRAMPRGVDATGLTFGAGEHRCPGQPLAVMEADALLRRLLRDRPRMLAEPAISWEPLIEGYVLRGLVLSWSEDDRDGLPGDPGGATAVS